MPHAACPLPPWLIFDVRQVKSPDTMIHRQLTSIADDCTRWEEQLRTHGAGLTGAYGIMARSAEHLDVLCALVVRALLKTHSAVVEKCAEKIGRKKKFSQFTLGERVRLLIGVWGDIPTLRDSSSGYVERCRHIREAGPIADSKPVQEDMAESDCPFYVRNALWWLVRTRNLFVHGTAAEMCESVDDHDVRGRDIGQINTLNFVRNLRDLTRLPGIVALATEEQGPNKAPEPTPGSVTPRAI